MDAGDLTSKKCKPCEGGILPLNQDEIYNYLFGIDKNWKVNGNRTINKDFAFVNFKHTMDFVNRVAALAEEEGHHPVMHVYYARVEIELWTHAIDGLSENDFILAAKIDQLETY